MDRIRMKKLTPQEHETYVHVCGKTGAEIEQDPSICEGCPRLSQCLDTHSVSGWERPRPGG